MGTIEDKIYRRQIYKKGMNLATIDSTGGASGSQDFEKYFKNTDLFELFQYDAKASETSCDTLEMLLERDGFPIVETPTNKKHVALLRSLESLVKGITLNTCLYTNNESNEPQAIQSSSEESKLPVPAINGQRISEIEEEPSPTA